MTLNKSKTVCNVTSSYDQLFSLQTLNLNAAAAPIQTLSDTGDVFMNMLLNIKRLNDRLSTAQGPLHIWTKTITCEAVAPG